MKKVDFVLSAEIAGDVVSGVVLGDFNNWNPEAGAALKKQKDGSFKASVNLEEGKKYAYRYFLSDGRWVNDNNPTEFDAAVGAANSVIEVAAKAAPAKKAAAPKAAPVVKAAEPKVAPAAKATPAKKAAAPKAAPVAKAAPAKKAAKKK